MTCSYGQLTAPEHPKHLIQEIKPKTIRVSVSALKQLTKLTFEHLRGMIGEKGSRCHAKKNDLSDCYPDPGICLYLPPLWVPTFNTWAQTNQTNIIFHPINGLRGLKPEKFDYVQICQGFQVARYVHCKIYRPHAE